MGSEILDQEELLHLALNVINQNQHSEAIELLKRSLEQDSMQAQIHYLLGAEYAQIGLYERAIESMSQAIELAPNLHLAVFQLGLLYLTQGLPEKAIETWAPLGKLDEQEPLRLFSAGLQHLAKDEFDLCRQNLELGIQLNQAIPVLNQDMQRVLTEIAALGSSTPNSTTETGTASSEPKQSVFLQAYADLPDNDKLH